MYFLKCAQPTEHAIKIWFRSESKQTNILSNADFNRMKNFLYSNDFQKQNIPEMSIEVVPINL
jgi:hypothetical protein